MDAKELAARLNGGEYPFEVDRELAKAAKDAGLVIVYGSSDDLMEFEGAIHDEAGAHKGSTVLVDAEGLLPLRENIEDDEELERYFARKKLARPIEAQWCAEPNYSWTYRTAIPHETFEVTEEGEPYCRGIVFALVDVAFSS